MKGFYLLKADPDLTPDLFSDLKRVSVAVDVVVVAAVFKWKRGVDTL